MPKRSSGSHSRSAVSGADDDDAVTSGDERLPLVAEDFLIWLSAERGRAPSTIAAYRRDLRHYQRWLAANHLELVSVTTSDLERYVTNLRDEAVAPSTMARRTVAVRSMYRFLTEEAVVTHDPGARVATPRVPAGLPKALSEEEVERLLSMVVGDDAVARRDRALLELLYGTGARISEVVGLSVSDVDLHGSLVRVLGKGSKERVIPLGRHARDALAAWFDPGGRAELSPERWARRGDEEAVFLNRRGGRLHRQGAWLIVSHYGDDAGLGDRLTPHVLRHSCATHMLDHGADIRAVQELLGHASISTTQVYTKVSTARLWDIYRSAHPRARVSSEE